MVQKELKASEVINIVDAYTKHVSSIEAVRVNTNSECLVWARASVHLGENRKITI